MNIDFSRLREQQERAKHRQLGQKLSESLTIRKLAFLASPMFQNRLKEASEVHLACRNVSYIHEITVFFPQYLFYRWQLFTESFSHIQQDIRDSLQLYKHFTSFPNSAISCIRPYVKYQTNYRQIVQTKNAREREREREREGLHSKHSSPPPSNI